MGGERLVSSQGLIGGNVGGLALLSWLCDANTKVDAHCENRLSIGFRCS